LNEISAKIGAWVLYTGVRTSTELTNFFRLVIHRSIQVPVSVVKCIIQLETRSDNVTEFIIKLKLQTTLIIGKKLEISGMKLLF
jgi:hypothetical protein